jgi:hypothetical protein
LAGPSLKVSHLLPKRVGVGGLINIPDLVLDGAKECFEAVLTALTNFEKSVQETFDDHN